MSRFPQSLLEDPNVIEVAASMNMTPEQYLQSIIDKPPAILENLESGPRMDTGPTVATQPAPVLTPRVPGEGVIAAPVANPADAPTSYADMSPQDFQRMAQNPADVPAGAEFPGLGADFSGIERFDSAMEQRTQAAREGIDQGVLQQQAASGDARALAELERRRNVPQGPALAQLEAENSQSPALQAPVDFATLEAQNSKSPVLINTTTPTPTTTANTQTNAAPVLGTKSSTATRAPALSRGAGKMTANARGSALGITPRGESLIRIGGAMYSGALKGDGLGAATREFGSIQDANRKAEVDAYNKAEATRIAELRAKGKGKGKNKKLAGPPTAVYKQATLSAITRIKDLLNSESGFNPFDNVTGWTGSLLSSVPGTPAHDVLNSINTIEAAVGFDRLQKMRDDSPTGGALGQVTERELALLSQSLGSLKQSSSREMFIANLEAVEQHYQAAVAAVEAQQAEWYRMNGGTAPTKPTAAPSNTGSSNMSAADAIVGI